MKSKNRKTFKVPKGYFDDLERSLLKKTRLNYNAYGYRTSKDYFNRLEKEILRKTSKVSNLNKSKIFKLTLLTISGVAASLIVFYNFSFTSSSQPFVIIQKEEVFKDFIETYYLEDFNSYEVLSMLEENEIETTLIYTSIP